MVIRRKQAQTEARAFCLRIRQNQLVVFPLIITSKSEKISNYLIYKHHLPTPKMLPPHLHQEIPQRIYNHDGKYFCTGVIFTWSLY